MESPRSALDGEESQEIKIDPKTLAPDLYAAAKADNLEEVQRLLAENVPATYVEKELGWTALHWAAKAGNTKMTAALLAAGASGPYHRQLLRENRVDLGVFVGAENNDENKNEANGAGTGGDTAKEEEDEDELGVDTATDYTKNTPLLWATFKAHLGVVWLLLMDGYSPNDVDDLNNNALHLAAASNNKKVTKVLIEDGTMPTAVNIYKNRPIDMTCDNEIRELLTMAMKAGASMTDKDIQQKHLTNMQKHREHIANFESTVLNLNRLESPRALRTLPNLSEASAELASVISVAKEEKLDAELITSAEAILDKFDLIQELHTDLEAVHLKPYVTTETEYIDTCDALERTVERCEAAGIPRGHLLGAHDALTRCRVSLRLCTLERRLSGITCAAPENHHDMVRLSECVRKAEATRVSDELIGRAFNLFKRLDAEEKMSIALRMVPEVRLPKEEPPEDYWRDIDTGAIEQHEGYPLPPVGEDGTVGDYNWVPSVVYTQLKECIEALKGCTDGAEELGANEEVRLEALATLKKCEKDMKALSGKDAEDKAAAIEQATKEAKKLKKKGKKK